MQEAFDVLIAGAGPAGSATALALARRGLRVALLERSRFDNWRVGESLPPSVQPLLRELVVWEQFEKVPQVMSFGGLSVWGDDEPRAQSYLAQHHSCGFHVDRKAFDRMLAEAAQAAGAELQLGAAVEGCERTAAGYRVSVRRGAQRSALDTRVLVDATGRRAHVSRQLGAQRLLFDRAVAVASRLQVRTESYLLVEAAAPGWFYSAPLSDDTLSVMWMTDADLCSGMPLTAAIAQAPWTHARAGFSKAYAAVPEEPATARDLEPLAAAAQGPRRHTRLQRPGERAELPSAAATMRAYAGLPVSEASAPRQDAGADRARTRPDEQASLMLLSAAGDQRTQHAGVPLTTSAEAAAWTRASGASNVRVFCAHSQRMSHAPARLNAAGPYLAVGDAALAVDPIAGDGVARALRSAKRAALTVMQLLAAPQAQHELLEDYAAECDAECTRYLQKRVHYYAAEQRFATPYWQRRCRATAADAAITPR